MGRLFSTYILEDGDEVAIEKLAFGQNQRFVSDVSQDMTAFEMKQIIKKIAKHIKDSYIPISEQCSNKYNGEQFYIKVIGNNGWIPVDHFLWKENGKKCKIDFTDGLDYLSNKKRIYENFYKRHHAINRFANMVGN